MSTERAELPGEEDERGWRERIGEVSAAAKALVGTRLEILKEELSGKAALAARGLAAAVVAAALAVGALLLAAALLAAVFARLTNSVVLGILAAVLLYGAGAAAAGWFGWKALARVRPFEYPASTEEISRDVRAIAATLAPETGAEEAGEETDTDEEAVADLEARLRAGME
jgi:hypothetical protein